MRPLCHAAACAVFAHSCLLSVGCRSKDKSDAGKGGAKGAAADKEDAGTIDERKSLKVSPLSLPSLR